ncbi:MAG: tRNA (guanosine(37)-N1)-methyltransferase TrmD [Clostridia bacterium]|nr:tRNA (guanosine(37)-N1)-methyltransferase TrmD [Clostridia bacterium]
MRIDILTLFPEMFEALNHSIIKRAKQSGKIEINITNIRDFSKDPHKKCDDYPYGGGAGMVMMVQPIVDAYNAVKSENCLCLYTSPRGQTLSQTNVKSYAKYEHIVIICGHYEGIDERAIEITGAKEFSIGDYVLTGGELPAMVFVDAVSRYVDGVINSQSLQEESFASGMLEYPQYTRPEVFMGKKVPEVLLSGHHKNIEDWRKQKSLEITQKNRPDLLNND